MSNETIVTCAVCGGTQWTPLPDPGAQSMVSDGRVVPEPLARRACRTCGVAARMPSAATGGTLYHSGYDLYAHMPGEPRERTRQAEYASWILSRCPTPPTRVLDVGCGNGSLLRALRVHWPHAELLGCDPSPESIQSGADRDLQLWQGRAGDLPPGLKADLVISVNVIEHTPDPTEFIAGLKRALDTQGTLIVVCPNGMVPDVELLIADHLFSFTPAHLCRMLARQDLAATALDVAPSSLGHFQMVVAQHGIATEAPFTGVDALSERRRMYLERWRHLDRELRARIMGPVICFGAGEAAGLLRAYAPASWMQVRACTFDGALGGVFGGKPIVPFEDLAKDTSILVGVRPRDQRSLTPRLRAAFGQVVTWYDLIPDAHAT